MMNMVNVHHEKKDILFFVLDGVNWIYVNINTYLVIVDISSTKFASFYQGSENNLMGFYLTTRTNIYLS